jgi:hypothetical protein
MRILDLDLVDQINAEIAVHRFVTQDVLILLCGTDHLVLPAQGKDLHKTYIEEQAFHQARKHDQATQQGLTFFSVPLRNSGSVKVSINGIRN